MSNGHGDGGVRVEPDENDPRIWHVVVDRPARRNAIAAPTAEALREAWERFEASEARVAVISGAGSLAFSSGADLDDPPRDVPCLPGSAVAVSKPIIAAVSGWCVGLGVVITQMADLCIADETARFVLPELRIGKTGAAVLELVGRIPLKAVMELLYAEEIDAARALQLGMVNRVVPRGEHLRAATELAARLAELDPASTAWVKQQVAALLPRTPGALADSVNLFQRRTLDR